MKSQAINNSQFIQDLLRSKIQLDKLTIRKVKRIPVRNYDLGFFTQKDITVQVLEDDEVIHCNHAGCYTDEVSFNEGLEEEYTKKALVCDKCSAWSYDEENWNE